MNCIIHGSYPGEGACAVCDKVEYAPMKVTLPKGMTEQQFIEATKRAVDEGIKAMWLKMIEEHERAYREWKNERGIE